MTTPSPPEPPSRAGGGVPDFETMGEEEISQEILNKRICDFDLRIEGRPLEKVIERFRTELTACGIVELHPAFYLTDEWGVPEGTVAIGLPFYLADAKLLQVHKRKRAGLVEGESDEDVLGYLRHEMGHVVNYAYRLYATEEWTQLFGPMSRPYLEEYRVVPFSPDFVRHLPGGYAQKHPDEDWAETFALWMTPGHDWRAMYQDAPGALAKLEYCRRTMERLRDVPPEVTSTQIDDDARDLETTVQEYYEAIDLGEAQIPHSLDGDLSSLFARHRPAPDAASPRLGDAATLLRRHGDFLANSVYRWTGVDPSLTAPVAAHLARRAGALGLQYPLHARDEILVELSCFLTTLAMNYQYRGKFVGD